MGNVCMKIRENRVKGFGRHHLNGTWSFEVVEFRKQRDSESIEAGPRFVVIHRHGGDQKHEVEGQGCFHDSPNMTQL